MSYVCLWSPDWSTAAAPNDSSEPPHEERIAAILPALLAHAPRVIVEESESVSVSERASPSHSHSHSHCRIWADARGLHAATLAEQLLDVLRVHGFADARAGTALTPIAASVAASWPESMRDSVMRCAAHGDVTVRQSPAITSVRPGRDREFLADFSVDVLEPSDFLANLLDGIGIDTCGRLAALDAQSVEIRLGTDGVDLWERARAEDGRWLFRTPLRSLPSASFEWTDYALKNTERLLFVINSLLASVCAALVEQGKRAREISLAFSLMNRTQHVHPLRSARPSADQKRWLRLVRDALEQLQLPDAVTGIALRVDSVTGNDGSQGDLFDRGFASIEAVETTLAQLADDHGELIMAPIVSGHPLAEKRTSWSGSGSGSDHAVPLTHTPTPTPTLTLQLLDPPRSIAVNTEARRDHEIPIRYRDTEGWHTLVDVAGPDRVSGGQWDNAYSRQYYRCVREDGLLVWMYRGQNDWYLQGWWD